MCHKDVPSAGGPEIIDGSGGGGPSLSTSPPSAGAAPGNGMSPTTRQPPPPAVIEPIFPPPASAGTPERPRLSTEQRYRPVVDALSHFLFVTRATENGTVVSNFWAPRMLRLAWHASGTWDPASGTGGSDGATMRCGLCYAVRCDALCHGEAGCVVVTHPYMVCCVSLARAVAHV
jgi:hypothetical protein